MNATHTKGEQIVERSKHRRETKLTTIKTGFNTFFINNQVKEMIKASVDIISRLSYESILLSNIHVLDSLKKRDRVLLTPLFYTRCMSAICSLHTTFNYRCNDSLKNTLEEFEQLLPTQYEAINVPPFLSHMLGQLAVQISTNAKNALVTRRRGHIKKWINIKINNIIIRQNENISKVVIKKIANAIYYAITVDDANETFDVIISRYTSIMDHPFVQENLNEFHHDIVDVLRQRIIEVPDKLQFSYSIL